MAELNYEDVRRATQDVVRNVQNVVNEISSSIHHIRNETARMGDLQNRVANIERNMSTLMSVMQRIDYALRVTQANPPNAEESRIISQRVVNIEHMIASMNQYLQVLHEHVTKLNRIYDNI